MKNEYALLTHLRLDTFASLKDNWDNNGSCAPSPLVIDVVRSLLPGVSEYNTEAYVGGTGEIELVWRDSYMYCEVSDDRCEFGTVTGAVCICDHASILDTLMRLRTTNELASEK